MFISLHADVLTNENMKIIQILTILFTVCCAKIEINIETSKFLNRTKILFSGKDIKLVTDEEVALFNITHENLNRGIRIEMGKVPDDIFLRDPTPYEDLFKQYKWPEVGRVLRIKSTKILEFLQSNVVIKTHEHINNATLNIKSKTDMMEVVENTALSLWSANGLPADVIHNKMNINFGYGNWSFHYKWRNETLKSVRLPFGASKGIVDLKSGQTIISKLCGLKTVMLVEIEYTAKLIGNIITDYDKLYGKYHFYSPALERIMKVANLTNEIITREFLEVRFYANPKLEVFDKDTGEELYVEMKKLHWRKMGNYIFHH